MKENQKLLLQLRYDKEQLFIITCVDVEFVDALRKPCNNNAFLMKTMHYQGNCNKSVGTCLLIDLTILT